MLFRSPESVKDRPTSAHEKVWLLTKSPKYFYDADAISEEFLRTPYKGSQNGAIKNGDRNDRGKTIGMTTERKNARNVWSITPKPFKGAHFATMPIDLAERCIKAGCPVGGLVLDPFGGAGTTGLAANNLQRNATLVEINIQYVNIINDRIGLI